MSTSPTTAEYLHLIRAESREMPRLDLSMRIVRIVLLSCLVLAARVSQASTISYDEAVSGDLEWGGDGPTSFHVFTLDVGANAIKGSSHIFCACSPGGVPHDFDDFGFVVPAAMHVTGIAYSFDAFLNPPGGHVGYRLREDSQPGTPVFGTSFVELATDTSPVTLFGPPAPLGPGAYFLLNVPGGYQGIIYYTMTIDVAEGDLQQVAEPATVCLFGTGIALGWVRRRRVISRPSHCGLHCQREPAQRGSRSPRTGCQHLAVRRSAD